MPDKTQSYARNEAALSALRDAANPLWPTPGNKAPGPGLHWLPGPAVALNGGTALSRNREEKAYDVAACFYGP
jgi:hypothetical protein